MLGAIIGDLAAWTYEQDKELFYAQLICSEAPVSEFGMTVFATSDALENVPQLTSNHFLDRIKPWYRVANDEVVMLSPKAREWTETLCVQGDESVAGMVLMRTVVHAWWRNCGVPELPFRLESDWDDDIEKAVRFLSRMIVSLSTGRSKNETYADLGEQFKAYRHGSNWQQGMTMLDYLMRAWDAFYQAFDFGSALHNAMRLPGNRRLNGALTGAVAEAMYGCGQYFVKKKYIKDKGDGSTDLRLSEAIYNRFGKTIGAICTQKEWVRTFWAKNNSRTNVERHHFTPIKSKCTEKVISKELRRRIIKSFNPGWDDRYSFYLDDGWIYLCRSFCLIARFQLQEQTDGTYRICHLQEGDEDKDTNNALQEALYSAEYHWCYLESPYKYYHCYCHPDGDELPKEFQGTRKASFWHGEMMLHKSGDDIGRWLADGLAAINRLNNPRLFRFAKALGQERFGTVSYINELYLKFCPYDNLDWIFEY